MDPVKKDGKIREQIEIEHEVRRRYDKKWGGPVHDNGMTTLYDPNKVNTWLKTSSVASSPDAYTGHGESHQISPEMYNALQAVCRCGRPKQGAHLLKCLQAQPPKWQADRPTEDRIVLPRTSMGMYGWPSSTRYAHLQHDTRYVSPTNDIPGGRLTDRPHASVFIG